MHRLSICRFDIWQVLPDKLPSLRCSVLSSAYTCCRSLAAAMGNADAVISAIGGSGDASTYHAVDNEVLITHALIPLIISPILSWCVLASTKEVLRASVSLGRLRHTITP